MATNSDELARIRDTLESVRRTLDTRLADDTVREQAFEKLYGELKDYKDDFVAQQERPLLLDLLLLYDSMNWFHAQIVKKELSPDAVADSFQFLLDELLEVLYRRDVVPMEPKVTFDPTLHRAVQLQKAGAAGDDNRIAQVVKRGFLRHEKPLRPEDVVVFKWKAGPESP